MAACFCEPRLLHPTVRKATERWTRVPLDASKLVFHENGVIVLVFSRPRILQERAGKKAGVAGAHVHVPAYFPIEDERKLVPDIAAAAAIRSLDDAESVAVDAVSLL